VFNGQTARWANHLCMSWVLVAPQFLASLSFQMSTISVCMHVHDAEASVSLVYGGGFNRILRCDC